MATDILNITEVSASQSQKEVTINEAINALANASNASVVILVADVSSLQIPSVAPDWVFDRNITFDLTPDMTPPSGAFTVELPATKRLFLVRNLTSQAATIEVDPDSDGPDGTTVAIPAGESRLLYSDGTDVEELSGGGGGGGGGVVDFTDLGDVPSAYTGDAGKAVAVNGTEDGLEFITFPGGGGGGWSIVSTQTVGSPVNNITFTGLGSYSELLLVFTGATKSSASVPWAQVSEDGGSSWLSSSAYETFATNGTLTANSVMILNEGAASTANRGGWLHMFGTDQASSNKLFQATGRQGVMVASTAAIDALRVILELTPASINFTAGTFVLFGK